MVGLVLELMALQDVVPNNEMLVIDLSIIETSYKLFNVSHGAVGLQVVLFKKIQFECSSCIVVRWVDATTNGGAIDFYWQHRFCPINQ